MSKLEWLKLYRNDIQDEIHSIYARLDEYCSTVWPDFKYDIKIETSDYTGSIKIQATIFVDENYILTDWRASNQEINMNTKHYYQKAEEYQMHFVVCINLVAKVSKEMLATLVSLNKVDFIVNEPTTYTSIVCDI